MAEAADEKKDPLADTNMENYGGEEHRAKQKAIAQNQKEWKKAGEKEGVQVWRIMKFKVVKQKDFTGEFYDGDAYIVLNSYKTGDGDDLAYNAHFWLGRGSTQDEQGTAAIKTVELDDFLGDLPKQYREVDGMESKEFKQCFRSFSTLEGGVESGFVNVKPEEYAPRLLHFIGNMKKQECHQVPLSVDSLNDSDVFVLDLGLHLIQFNGSKAAPMEKRAANEFVNKLASARNGRVKDKDTIDKLDEEGKAADLFFSTLGCEARPESLPEESNKGKLEAELNAFYDGFEKKMYHVVDESVNAVEFNKELLKQEGDDALIIDMGKKIYVWIGQKSSLQEKGLAMSAAIKMLKDQNRPITTQITRIMEGAETDEFNACF